MHELIFLKSLTIILGVSAGVVFLLHRIKIPSIVGFLLAGMLLGPHGLNFIKDTHVIQTLAEVGVILLLFVIGLEFSLSRFLKMRIEVFGVGGLYVLLCVVATTLIFYQWSKNFNMAVFVGFLVALSSTAIVMKQLSERAEIHSPHGRLSLGILILQDLCVVLFILLIPVMSGPAELGKLVLTIGKAIIIISAVILSARWFVPVLLHQIVRTQSRELFVITILILCFGTAFITAEAGLSLALGAFLAGLITSESEYGHEATSIILPFKDTFNGLFFISVGMLMDISFFRNNVLLVIAVVFGIILLKTLVGFLSMYLLRRPLRVSIQTSMNLAQIGEFSFVLAVAGLAVGLIPNHTYQLFLSASVLTMLLTPFIMQISPYISTKLSSSQLLKRLESIKKLSETHEFPTKMKDHTIVIGFGLNGRNLAKVLKETNIPYLVLELNIDIVRDMRRQGEPIFYGDGTKVEVLNKMGIKTARILVIAISDPASCRTIVRTARMQNPKLFIIVRTRYTTEVDELLELGADNVIPEEFETSIEIFSRVLIHYQVSKDKIYNLIETIRENGYKALRQTTPLKSKLTID